MPKLLPIQLGKVLYKLTTDVSAKELDKAVAVFLQFVHDEHMMAKLPYIISSFEAYAKRMTGKEDIEITSAQPLSKETIDRIVAQMNAGNDVTVTMKEDESIIGGVVVQKGNTVFDASIKAQLNKMKLSFN